MICFLSLISLLYLGLILIILIFKTTFELIVSGVIDGLMAITIQELFKNFNKKNVSSDIIKFIICFLVSFIGVLFFSLLLIREINLVANSISIMLIKSNCYFDLWLKTPMKLGKEMLHINLELEIF